MIALMVIAHPHSVFISTQKKILNISFIFLFSFVLCAVCLLSQGRLGLGTITVFGRSVNPKPGGQIMPTALLRAPQIFRPSDRPTMGY